VSFAVRQSVEIFHLVFLRALVAKGDDKSRIALKGGCNLRFFFGSARCSEDMDFDVASIAKGTLRNKVDRLLASPLVTAPLRTKGIELMEHSAPKQTDTTQRWTIGLQAAGTSAPVRTKLEFSRRTAIDGTNHETLGADVMRAYGLTPFAATHYATGAAVAQKIRALAGRSEPQARDVFDLGLLLSRSDASPPKLDGRAKLEVAAAIERALSISFDDYRSQVIAYLHPEQADLFASRSAWDTMQEAVIARLEALR
jgi:predicted nucleotidyltransferase component of viral defense system